MPHSHSSSFANACVVCVPREVETGVEQRRGSGEEGCCSVQATSSATLGPDLDCLREFPLLTPVRCCLAGMGRRGQTGQGCGREEKVCSSLKCSQFTIPGHSLPFLLSVASTIRRLPRLLQGGLISCPDRVVQGFRVKLKMFCFPLYLMGLPPSRDGC